MDCAGETTPGNSADKARVEDVAAPLSAFAELTS